MEKIWRCLFFFLFLITSFKKTYCESDADVDHVDAKIFNGNLVDIENFGYHLQIIIEGKFRCGASLISRSWALTAAQCTDGKTSEALSLFGGSRNFKEGTKIPIKGIVQHPNYDLRTKVDDIALLNFDPISFTKTLYPIALPKTGQAFVEGTKCNISGFGLDENFKLPGILLAAEVSISDQDICIQNYVDKGVTVVNSTMICAGTKDFKDTCSGDEVSVFFMLLPISQ